MPATITAAICDTVLILLAILGVFVDCHAIRLVAPDINHNRRYIFYCIWAFRFGLPNQTHSQVPNPCRCRQKKQIVFALSVSLLNPHAILDTIGVIGSSSLVYSGKDKMIFTMTCIFVSWCWFHGLCLAGRLLKKVDTSGKFLGILNKISAIIIWITALYMVKSLFLNQINVFEPNDVMYNRTPMYKKKGECISYMHSPFFLPSIIFIS
ncbi:LysE family transporter [Peribacillus frigoritolerans]|nr:LysE family transporter [Peribacillus frigoritolerans]